MEAVRDFIGDFTACGDGAQGTDRGAAPARQSGMDAALAALRAVGSTAAQDAGSWGFRAASDFAGSVEELSRTVEYLQLVAAAAVDRTRKQSAAATTGAAAGAGAVTAWTTGWRESPGGWQTGAPGTLEPAGDSLASAPAGTSVAAVPSITSVASAPAGTSVAAAPLGTSVAGAPAGIPFPSAHAGTSVAAAPAVPESVLDDGYRNTVEFLRARLRIGAAEARRRLCLADTLLPRQGLAGQPIPPVHPELGAAVASGEIASRAATVITLALDRVRHGCLPEAAAAMEHALTRTAAENDADFLARVSRSWAEALDQDGAEPSEELLRQLQGAFLRKPRHGLQHLEIFATADQFEHLVTVMNTATNPRTGPDTGEGTATGNTAQAGPGEAAVDPAGAAEQPGSPEGTATAEEDPSLPSLDLRSRPQRLLDGLVGACKAALATGGLPAAGGLRPQVMATIDYRDLLTRLGTTPAEAGAPRLGPRSLQSRGALQQTGSLAFTGPVTAGTIRKIACDADIIPVVLGGEGQVLDVGRASRVFPPHIRKAITARDQGCAFPQCTIPAPWCEAHHITYWSRGGTTGTGNGTLLCSHHHHVIHKEHWTIQMRTGIPWFIPPPHLDPARTPRRNRYFRPTDPVAAA
jgi:hypothetical protein